MLVHSTLGYAAADHFSVYFRGFYILVIIILYYFLLFISSIGKLLLLEVVAPTTDTLHNKQTQFLLFPTRIFNTF